MFKKIIISFSALLIFASLFYSCSEQPVQPALFVTPDQAVIFQKMGLVQILSSDNIIPKAGHFNTGALDAAGFKKLRITFKSKSNWPGSTISLFLKTLYVKNSNLLTVITIGENIEETDHSIDIEDPAEKIWLALGIESESLMNGDENYKYTKVSDLVIYGIR